MSASEFSRGPVLLRATADEAAGAGLKVAGLSVLERACKQLSRMKHRVILVTDGTVPLPAALPPAVEVRTIEGPEGLLPIRAELGPDVPEVPADLVRPSNRDLEGGLRVVDGASRRAAEDAIFGELLRGDLGFVARHFNKPVSFRITRHLLCHLPFTPNQVTLGAAAIGLAGAALIASGRHALMVLGFLLAHVQSVLDGCDGELARVRFQQSAIGEWLDTIVDDALNFVLFAAVGVGLWRETGSPWLLGLGVGAAAMMLAYNAVAYTELIRQGEGGEVIKIRWWFTKGADLKSMYAGKKKGPFQHLLSIGRRDFFLLAWVGFALAHAKGLIALYAFLVALANFGVAAGQVLWRLRGART